MATEANTQWPLDEPGASSLQGFRIRSVARITSKSNAENELTDKQTIEWTKFVDDF